MVDALTFDLAEFFAGTNFPTSEVTVFLDPEVSYKRNKISQALKGASTDEEREAVEKALDVLAKESEASKFVFHLTGVAREVKTAIYKSNVAKFKRKTNMFGQLEENPDADEQFTTDTWLAQIASVDTPDGKTILPDEAWVKTLRDKAPEPALKAIAAGIASLSAETEEGFETLVQDQAFLSMPSREG